MAMADGKLKPATAADLTPEQIDALKALKDLPPEMEEVLNGFMEGFMEGFMDGFMKEIAAKALAGKPAEKKVTIESLLEELDQALADGKLKKVAKINSDISELRNKKPQRIAEARSAIASGDLDKLQQKAADAVNGRLSQAASAVITSTMSPSEYLDHLIKLRSF